MSSTSPWRSDKAPFVTRPLEMKDIRVLCGDLVQAPHSLRPWLRVKLNILQERVLQYFTFQPHRSSHGCCTVRFSNEIASTWLIYMVWNIRNVRFCHHDCRLPVHVISIFSMLCLLFILETFLQVSRNEGPFQKTPINLHGFSGSGNYLELCLYIRTQFDHPQICIYQIKSGIGWKFFNCR